MNKPRIAILVPGGIGEHDNVPALLDLISRLSESYDLAIYSFSRLTPHPRLAAQHCTVSFAPESFSLNILLRSIYILWSIKKDHAVKNFSAVHGFWIMPQGMTAVLAGKILRVPSIVSMLGGDVAYLPSIKYGSMRNVFSRRIISWVIRKADRAAVLTRFQERIMEKNGIRRRDVSAIPFGVETSKFSFHPRPASSPLQFSFIGNLNRVKDPLTLIRTFSLLVQKFNCRLTVVGTDTLQGQVQEYARSLGVNDKISWKGKLSYELIPPVLQSTDFLLLTSLYEGQAVVVMEAYASGVVVFGSNIGLLADVEDERVTVVPGDAEGLAIKIEKVISQPQVIQEMQLKNRRFAERYSAEWTCSEYKRLYEEVLRQDK